MLVAGPTIQQLCNAFTEPVQQLAYQTVCTEISRRKLRWFDNARKEKRDMPVPRWWYQFVTEAIRCIMLEGFFAWKPAPSSQSLKRAVVAPVGTVTLQWDDAQMDWVIDEEDKEWRIVIETPPLRSKDGRVQLNSVAFRAYKDTMHLRELRQLWFKRDIHNSTPALFTTVSTQLQTASGVKAPWFITTSGGPRLEDDDLDLANKLAHRQEVVRALDDMSEEERARKLRTGRKRVGESLLDDNDSHVDHKEYVVTDGKEGREARMLMPQHDSKETFNSTRHQILYLLGVPPQILGENVNSERIAASNRLTELPIQAFQQNIENICACLSESLHDATLTGNYFIDFGHVPTLFDLGQLEGILKTPRLVEMLEDVYQLPPGYIDKEAVKRRQLMEVPLAPEEPQETKKSPMEKIPEGNKDNETEHKRRKRTDAEKTERAEKKAHEPN